MNDDIFKYNDIINLQHHVSKKHPQMSIDARAAQFAPFAALTGHSDSIKETARLTDKRIEIDEEFKKIIDRKLQIIQEKISFKPKISITYFIPDDKKKGGKYVTVIGNVKKIDRYNKTIVFTDSTIIPINEIIDIVGEVSAFFFCDVLR